MNLKLGLNIQTLVIAAIVLWIIYGSYQGGKAVSGTAGASDYAATT